MPSVTNVEPDSFDLDHFLSKCNNSFGAVTHDRNCRSLKFLPPNINPTSCDSGEGFHFFAKPIAPTITTCLCKKYHTYFASQHLTTPFLQQPTSETFSDSSSSIEIDFDIKTFKSASSLFRSKF